jgi:Tfp pilus assembly protein PilN
MRAVNLLTYDVGVRTRRLPAIPKPSFGVVTGIVAAVLLLLLGVTYLSASKAARDRQREVAEVKAEERAVVARLEGAETEQALADREQRDASLSAALGRRVPWDQVLRDVARVLPSQTSVTSLSAQAPQAAGTAAATTGAEGLLLTGLTFTQPTVALVLDRLELVPQLVDVQLQSSTKSTVAERDVRQFTIAAGIRAEGAP